MSNPIQEVQEEHVIENKPKSSKFNLFESTSTDRDIVRRREEFRCEVQSIENQIANWIYKLTEESLNREHSHSDILERAVYAPIEQLTQRVQSKLENQAGLSLQNPNSFNSFRSVERRIMDIDLETSKLEHVTVPYEKSEHLRPLEAIINEDIVSALREESSKSNKKELVISRQLEEIAGQTARDLQAEKAGRDTEIEMLNSEVNDQIYGNERRVTEFMDEIHEIQKNLDKEILERKKQDQMLLELILKTKEQLQETVYETLGGGENC